VHFNSVAELQIAAAELPLHDGERLPAQAASFLCGPRAVVGLPALAERDETTNNRAARKPCKFGVRIQRIVFSGETKSDTTRVWWGTSCERSFDAFAPAKRPAACRELSPKSTMEHLHVHLPRRISDWVELAAEPPRKMCHGPFAHQEKQYVRRWGKMKNVEMCTIVVVRFACDIINQAGLSLSLLLFPPLSYFSP